MASSATSGVNAGNEIKVRIADNLSILRKTSSACLVEGPTPFVKHDETKGLASFWATTSEFISIFRIWPGLAWSGECALCVGITGNAGMQHHSGFAVVPRTGPVHQATIVPDHDIARRPTVRVDTALILNREMNQVCDQTLGFVCR